MIMMIMMIMMIILLLYRSIDFPVTAEDKAYIDAVIATDVEFLQNGIRTMDYSLLVGVINCPRDQVPSLPKTGTPRQPFVSIHGDTATACVRARVCARACLRTCVHVCACVNVRACVHVRACECFASVAALDCVCARACAGAGAWVRARVYFHGRACVDVVPQQSPLR